MRNITSPRQLVFQILLVLLLFLPFAFAQPILIFEGDLFSSKAEITSLSVVDGKPNPVAEQGTYRITLLSKDGSVLYTTYTSMEEGAYLKMPYLPGAETLSVYKGSLPLASTSLAFCNADDRCEQGENHLSCRRDCPLEQKDSLCLAYADGICDPDCIAEDTDQDCSSAKASSSPLPETPATSNPFLIIAIVVLLIFLLFFYIRKEKRNASPPQQMPSSGYIPYQGNYQNYQNYYQRK